jgi:hypothetical protein
MVDSGKYSYAGIYDYGNSAIDEGHDFTGTANFIEWFGNEKPTVYFANASGRMTGMAGQKTPLASNARFIGLEWNSRSLPPGQSTTYTLAIGMAEHDPERTIPIKPEIRIPGKR